MQANVELKFMRQALRLALRARGQTSPNPIVGAILVKRGTVIGRGWHRQAGLAHAEIEAINDALARKQNPAGATLYVTLEPCSTRGRTGPCTDAIRAAGIKKVVIGAVDPNPRHAGRGLKILNAAGISVQSGVLSPEIERANESFNHWIIKHTPFVTLKSAMSLDGRIATASGESRWITGETARARGMQLRRESDAILVGINTVLRDDPRLTPRPPVTRLFPHHRIVLDAYARTPPRARVLSEQNVSRTIIVTSRAAPKDRVAQLKQKANVWTAPSRSGALGLDWVLRRLGSMNITSLLVEGGGQVNAAFLSQGHVQRVAFFYGPLILSDVRCPRAVAGDEMGNLNLHLANVEFRVLDDDIFLTARII